jgi:hypothetical protein
MLRAITTFRGEAPRVSPHLLPDNAAQDATNAKLLTGNLSAWRQFSATLGLANPGPVQTIFLLDNAWLSWGVVVDVARGTVAGDTTYRTYLTAPGFYSEPRFTNYALATTGSTPYPVTTRPLGTPAPESAPSLTVGVGTTPTTDVTDSGDQLAASWVTSAPVSGGGIVSLVTQDAAVGNPAPSYKLECESNTTAGAYAYRDFGIETSVAVEYTSQFAPVSNGSVLEASWRVLTTDAGAGPVVKIGYPAGSGGGIFLQIGVSSAWGAVGSWLTQVPMSALDGTGATWYDMVITATQNDSGTTTVNAKLYQGSGLLAEAEVTSTFSTGGNCGVEMVTSFVGSFYTHYDNFRVTATGSTTVPVSTATSYVYTFVNDLDQESAPSPASSTILRPDGVTVTVTTPTAVPSGVSTDYGIDTKRIYRAATGNAGTEFRFVAEIPLTTADYDDNLTDSELGEVLPSTLWALPPDDLEGILALPNGVMAGFSKNQLCLSAQNFPHAWPVEYRLNTDTDIVGIGNVDTTVVIGTESFVYVASGNDPAAYSMAKFEVPYACSSKRSFAYLTGIGVVFAGPDGLMAVTGPGQVRNLTDPVFTRDQWQALNPESIVGIAHNDIYWMFWESGSNRGCYAIDMKATGFGVVRMAFHACAAYVDPIEDKMYLVLDQDDEPDDSALPVPADPPNYIDGTTIFEFEGNPSVLMTYRYRGKLWLLPYPAWFSIFQVKADDYDNILLRIFADGVQVEEIAVTEETEFTVECVDSYTRLEYELLGTSPVRLVQGAEDISELG